MPLRLRQRQNVCSMSAFVLVLLLLLGSVQAQADSNLFTMLSPKLQHFLAEHPAASQSLTNSLFEAFTNRTVRLYYFYSEDESLARALHYYPGPSEVGIAIRENQQPVDEYICLFFEVLNSEGEGRFKDIMSKAQSGAITKTNFVLQISEVEFEATKRARDTVRNLKFGAKEVSESYFYKRLAQCPETFADFIPYIQSLSAMSKRNYLKELEAKYDALRGSE